MSVAASHSLGLRCVAFHCFSTCSYVGHGCGGGRLGVYLDLCDSSLPHDFGLHPFGLFGLLAWFVVGFAAIRGLVV